MIVREVPEHLVQETVALGWDGGEGHGWRGFWRVAQDQDERVDRGHGHAKTFFGVSEI